jgi:hypothetical protein
MVQTPQWPICPHCEREMQPGRHWYGANWCRAWLLLPWIEANPGHSTWEICQGTGLSYGDASKALMRTRDMALVNVTPEERAQGGFRYRYSSAPDWRDRLEPMLERVS